MSANAIAGAPYAVDILQLDERARLGPRDVKEPGRRGAQGHRFSVRADGRGLSTVRRIIRVVGQRYLERQRESQQSGY